MDADTEISIARPADALALAEMSRDLIEKGLGWSWKPSRVLAMIEHPDCVVLMAQTRLEIAGFAIMEFHEEHGHLNLLAVKPHQQRNGVGKAILEWLEQSAMVAGIARITLEVRIDNEEAIAFYEGLQFQKDKILKGYYQGKKDALRMVHHLMTPEMAAQRP
jgi:ribosomal-protein-alanine N-acetyltransferase